MSIPIILVLVVTGALPSRHSLAADALSYILRNAETLGTGTADDSVWGSSAGARMAAAIGSPASFGADPVPKPAAVVIAYTSDSDHVSRERPTFVVDDGIAPPTSVERRIDALRSLGHRRRVSEVSERRPCFRDRCRYKRERIDCRCHAVLAGAHEKELIPGLT